MVSAYTAKMQATTLFVGKKICNPMLQDVLPRGYQDAITPKSQDRLNLIRPTLWVIVLITGSLIHWYLGIIGLIFDILILHNLFSFLVPQNLSYYVNLINIEMANRYANYKKEGDEERALAAKEIGDKLSEYYLNMDKNTKVPYISEAKKTDFGF